MRYFIELSYDGSNFCGWQRQNEDVTVQGTVEQWLSTLLSQPTEIVGAGRTDSGVHATFYVAHFDYTGNRTVDPEQLCYKLNRVLPKSIAIARIYEVEQSKHARFDAKEREYTYVITRCKSPFNHHVTWYNTQPLDMEAMNRAASKLLTHSDFTSFAKLGSDNKSNICRVTHAEWVEQGDSTIIFTIRADRFLRNMVRSIVGTLVDVGRGRYTPEQFDQIIESRDLSRSSSSAPASGLRLSGIKY